MSMPYVISCAELFIGVVIIAANLFQVKKNTNSRFIPIRIAKIVAGVYAVWANVEFIFLNNPNHYHIWISYLVLIIVVAGVSVMNLEKMR